MTADPFLSSMTRGAMSTAFNALRQSQSDVANARARGPAPAPAPGYPPVGTTDPNLWAFLQQQAAQTAYFMQMMSQQNQMMMQMVMMLMYGQNQNANTNQLPYNLFAQLLNPYGQGGFPIDMFISQEQMNQLPSDQQDEVQQLMLGLLAKLQIAMSQLGAFTGSGNQNTIYNSELGLIRADLSTEAQTALIDVKNEVAKVSMSSASINEAVKQALTAGANPNDIYQAVRNGYNKDEQLRLSRFYAAMAQPTKTADMGLQELYKALSQKAAAAETPDDYTGLFV